MQTFLPNKHGYTIMGEALSQNPLPASRWGVRILSHPEFPQDSEQGLFQTALTPPPLACELVQPIQPKKYNVLFRFVSSIALLPLTAKYQALCPC